MGTNQSYTPSQNEPNYAAAASWWAEMPNIWTPVAWKDHMHRFNIFWNGSILAEAHLNPNTVKYQGLGMQVTPLGPFFIQDDGHYRQGWKDSPAPVLWTEIPIAGQGIMLRWSAFAHIPGGGDVESGEEPIFAWVRFSISDVCTELPLEETFKCPLYIQGSHVYPGMSIRNNLKLDLKKTQYPRPFVFESDNSPDGKGYRLLEEGNKVRIGIPAGTPHPVCYAKADDVYPEKLEVELPIQQDAHFDVLIPMIPMEQEIFDKELALGYDAALTETNRYWNKTPDNAAEISLPEKPVEEAIKHSVRFFEMLTERNCATGKYCMVNGSLQYAMLWATPGAMGAIMQMDILGYHDLVGKYLEIFRDEQGTVRPPSDYLGIHPGYLSTPELYKSIDWLSDNGAILYMLAMHGLYSGDREYIERFTDTLLKSCEWIRDARRNTNHDGAKGILPPGVATDNKTQIQGIWNDGWNYKGMTTTLKLLRQIKHPRAEEFAREVDDYRTAFANAYRSQCMKNPTWTDAAGNEHYFAPTALYGASKYETRMAFYLDTGPIFLVFSGLLDADDELMQSALLWFREGPQRRMYRPDGNCWQLPVLEHEMSSCEPCYSWNVFHTHQTGDREKFLEGMYSLFAGSMSQQTYISCETRGGITGNIFSSPLAIYLARLTVIDDEVEDGALHLLRLVPQAWLQPGVDAKFLRMPTYYGPVDLQVHVSEQGDALNITFSAKYRTSPQKVVLHLPRCVAVKTYRVNGNEVKSNTDWVELPIS